MANTFICVRHPDKDGDAEGVYWGDRARITQKGEQEAEILYRRIAALREHPELVLSSTLLRSLALAQRIGIDLFLPYQPNALFDEIGKPDFFEGIRKDDPVYRDVSAAIRALFDDDEAPAGIPVKRRSELEEETRRTFAYIESLTEDTVLLVGHAKRIASYIHWVYCGEKTLRGFYDTADRTIRLSTTGITIFKREAGRHGEAPYWQLYCVNDVSHQEGFLDNPLGNRFLHV